MTIERMFLAISPPAEVVDVIADLPTRALRGVRFTKRKQWHITMRFLGDCERQEALNALAAFHGASGDITLGPEVSLLGTRVVIVPAAGLDSLAAQVDDEFGQVGEPTDREFVGHLTIARLKGRPLKDPSLVSVLGAPISATWHQDTIDLWKSEVTADGATHTLVATQELG